MEFEKLKIPDRKIIVGIDFGTTYSGIAWAETQRPDRREAIKVWPKTKTNRQGESSAKVPTSLRYVYDGIQWGFTVPGNAPAKEVVKWFKMALDPTLASVANDLTEEVIIPKDRTIDGLVTDYLSALRDHLIYILHEKLGDMVLKTTPIEFVVTVPAIWSDIAKDKTRQACLRGLRNLTPVSTIRSPIHLVSEPEAAALYALHGLDPHGLKVGDTFVVCDAGGGTVDVITYTITRLRPVLEVREAAPGSGALCGSVLVNVQFRKFLEAKLRGVKGFDDRVLEEAMDRFERHVKPAFVMDDPEEMYSVPVGGIADNKMLGVERANLELRASDIQACFDPAVRATIGLVQKQIAVSRMTINAVLLVGGFGSSQYLKKKLLETLGGEIKVLQPPNAWLAVVQGAVMKGLALSAPEELTMPKVNQRKARKHYGFEFGIDWDDRRHQDYVDKRYWDGVEGRFKVDVMDWVIERGDAVSENKPLMTHFYWTGVVEEDVDKKLRVAVYADETEREAPIVRDDKVKLLCHIEADLSHIPEDKMKHRKGYDERLYYDLSCQIESKCLSASTQYTLIYKNKRYDTVTAEYV